MLIITVQIFSLCWQIFPCVRTKFPVFSLSGKSKNQIPCFPCFPCAVATLVQVSNKKHTTLVTDLSVQITASAIWKQENSQY